MRYALAGIAALVLGWLVYGLTHSKPTGRVAMTMTLQHECYGPVCQGKVTTHRADGFMVVNGERLQRWLCLGCYHPPKGMRRRGWQGWDEDGKVIAEGGEP